MKHYHLIFISTSITHDALHVHDMSCTYHSEVCIYHEPCRLLDLLACALQARRPAERDADTDPQWRKHIAALKRRWKVSNDFCPWTESPSFKGYGLAKTPRVLSILDGVAIEKSQGKRVTRRVLKNNLKNTYVDVSQSLPRKAFTNSKGVNRTQTTSTRLYSYENDALVIGKEMLGLHGQPISTMTFPNEIKDNVLHELAGEGMAVPCVGLVMWALFLTAQFP